MMMFTIFMQRSSRWLAKTDRSLMVSHAVRSCLDRISAKSCVLLAYRKTVLGKHIFTVHTGKKGSKKQPYSVTDGLSLPSTDGKGFEVQFKIKSERNDEDAQKLVDEMIGALKREFATEPERS
jgi:hypothetical protein